MLSWYQMNLSPVTSRTYEQGDQISFWNISQNVANPVYTHNAYWGKNCPKMWANSIIFYKLANLNTWPIGKNLTSLVTLLMSAVNSDNYLTKTFWQLFYRKHFQNQLVELKLHDLYIFTCTLLFWVISAHLYF
jgi:hypothetical protein